MQPRTFASQSFRVPVNWLPPQSRYTLFPIGWHMPGPTEPYQPIVTLQLNTEKSCCRRPNDTRTHAFKSIPCHEARPSHADGMQGGTTEDMPRDAVGPVNEITSDLPRSQGKAPLSALWQSALKRRIRETRNANYSVIQALLLHLAQ